MKYIYSITIFFFTLFINAQYKSGSVKYSVKSIENTNSELDKFRLSMYPNFLTISNEFEFELSFNQNESFFKIINKLYSDEAASEVGLLKINFNGNILYSKDSIYNELDLGRIGNYILRKKATYNWTITKESKFIDNYECYKATCEITVINPKGVFKHPIIAWFCPKIPYPYGPNGFGGLPGLILELQSKDAVYGVTKIIFSNDEITIDKLKNYKLVTENELDDIIIKNN